MHRYTITVTDGPIDMDRIAKSGQMFRWRILDDGWEIYDGADFYRLCEIGSQQFEVESNRDEATFRRLFRLEIHHKNQLDDILKLGDEMAPFLANRVGLRLMRPASKTETLFSFLCSSCNHVARITKMVWSLSERGSDGFPTCEEVAKISEATLRAEGFGYRGATIPKVAAILTSNGGDRYLNDLAEAGYSEARKELIALPGVGKKLADCICLFAFDYGESVPIDTHIWQVMTRLYFPQWSNTSLTDTKYETVSEYFRNRFGEHAGAAHQFLFVDNMERYRERASR